MNEQAIEDREKTAKLFKSLQKSGRKRIKTGILST